MGCSIDACLERESSHILTTSAKSGEKCNTEVKLKWLLLSMHLKSEYDVLRKTHVEDGGIMRANLLPFCELQPFEG